MNNLRHLADCLELLNQCVDVLAKDFKGNEELLRKIDEKCSELQRERQWITN